MEAVGVAVVAVAAAEAAPTAGAAKAAAAVVEAAVEAAEAAEAEELKVVAVTAWRRGGRELPLSKPDAPRGVQCYAPLPSCGRAASEAPPTHGLGQR